MQEVTPTPPIRTAANLVQSEIFRLKDAVGGPRLPDSAACWIEIMTYAGEQVFAILLNRKAVTVFHPALGWVVLFDRTCPQHIQCRQLAHEFSEFLLRTMEPPDEPCPPMPPEMSLREWRHLVSEEVVRLFWPS